MPCAKTPLNPSAASPVSAALCSGALVGGKADEVIAIARQFAAFLMGNGARLLEVPPHVIVSIVPSERESSTLLN